jgi:hypothetical protein
MLKRIVIAGFLLAALPNCAISQGNAQKSPPCPTPHIALSGEPKQVCECCQGQSNAEQRGSEASPLVIKLAQSEQTKNESAGDKSAAPKNPDQSWSLSDKIALIASVSAFLQFVALVVTIWVMILNGRRQLRAYIVLERGIIGNVADPPSGPGERVHTVARLMQPLGGPVAIITIKNTGQTPAYEVVHWGNIAIREFPLTSELPEMPKPAERHKSNLGPSIAITKTLRLPRPLSNEDIQALRESRMAIYCNGEIHYRDAFKKAHVTLYRCMYCAVNGEEIGTSTDLTLCEEGNTAD